MLEKLEQKYCGNANWTNEGLQPVLGHDNDNPKCDIIFVHGLAGHAWGTWHPEGKDGKCREFWLEWLWSDLKKDAIDVAIWTYGYKAPRLNWNGSAKSLIDQADLLLKILQIKRIAERPLIFITHSMGGLLVKQTLRTANERASETSANSINKQFYRKLINETKGIVFLSTPHGGSSLANPITRFIILPIGVNVAELQKNLSELRNLNQWFQDNVQGLQINIDVYYEEKSIFNILVVDRDSANPGIPGVSPAGVPEDHNSIAKPKSKEAIVYGGTKAFIKNLLSEGSLSQSIDIKSVRETIKPYIKERCGTMRVLDMDQPIGLNDIYTNVNILEKITGRRRLEIADLLLHRDPVEFERVGFDVVAEKRVPGLQAVEQHSKLMVLGKPGAGKSTFLKYLAMQCIEGQFQQNKVPIFITLKQFAETQNQPDLWEFITQQLANTSNNSITKIQISELLFLGKFLILLDGLDEVRQEDSSRVINHIKEFSEQYHKNQFVVTCRIAAREYTYEKFTEVEVADFGEEQIKDFVDKWFKAKDDLVKAERFIQKLKEDKPIQELASNPLLLTLLCLVFEESGNFPPNRSELYKEGLDVLLKKWDTKRNIERDLVYKKLSLKRKEDLLSQIALLTFEDANYFFKQKEAERYITEYIKNLPEASTDTEALELNSEAVLKSIEAQHGLFVERARGIYSFSHLTFHEYFTAKKIIDSPNPKAQEQALQNLINHTTEKRWREVFLLSVGMLPDADYLLQLMKEKIDKILEGDETLQRLLTWVKQKSKSIKAPYKPAGVRAFYLALNLDLTLGRDLALDLDLTLDLTLDLNLDLALDGDLARSLDFARALSRSLALAEVLDRDLDRALARDLYPELERSLQQLKDQLPNLKNAEAYKQWWQENGQAWTKQLRAAIIEHRNIGHDWQFSDEQRVLLKQYYDANLLLVDCLNSDCYVSREVRQEIEDTLLLPASKNQS